jgi:hypothetical protein
MGRRSWSFDFAYATFGPLAHVASAVLIKFCAQLRLNMTTLTEALFVGFALTNERNDVFRSSKKEIKE